MVIRHRTDERIRWRDRKKIAGEQTDTAQKQGQQLNHRHSLCAQCGTFSYVCVCPD